MNKEDQGKMDELMCLFYHGHRKHKKIISPSRRALMIKLYFGVEVIEVELQESEQSLREIITARMNTTCPKCSGVTKLPFCCLCKGSGIVTNIEKEKYKLRCLEKKSDYANV